MILNQLTNHVRELVVALRLEPVKTPDYITAIFDGYARVRTGAMAHSVSIPNLLKKAKAYFYKGLDFAQQIQDQRLVERHFAHWKHMYVNVSMEGILLKQVTGLTCTQMVESGYSLGQANASHQLQIFNILDTEYLTAAAGIQEKKVAAMHGHYQELEPDEEPVAPESLDDLFSHEEEFHGLTPGALGEWDKLHIWSRRPISNVGNTNVEGKNERKYIHRPIVRDIRYEDDGTTEIMTDAGSKGVRPTIKSLEPILRRYSMVVQGGKLGYMWDYGFSALVADILGRNLSVPQLIMGGAGWEYDIDCVKIAGVTIISDPNAVEGELRVLHVGDPGMENGTVAPFYFDAGEDAVPQFEMRARAMSANRERPRGMDFGRPIPTPYQGQAWRLSDTHVDAMFSRVLLDYIPVLALLRGYQLKLIGLDEKGVVIPND